MKKEVMLLKIAALYVFFPLALFAVPLSNLESLPSVCLYKNILGRKCPGCGMTRAALSLLHLHFADAFAFNRMIIIVFPLILFLSCRNLVKDVKQLKTSADEPI